MKKKNKIACLIACSLGAFIGAAQTYASYQQENTCLILLDGVAALSSGGSDNGSEKPKQWIENVQPLGDNKEHASCESSTDDGPNKHCLPQDDHVKGYTTCVHGSGPDHYSTYYVNNEPISCACAPK